MKILQYIMSLYNNFIAGDSFIELWFWIGIIATVALVAMCYVGRNNRIPRY